VITLSNLQNPASVEGLVALHLDKGKLAAGLVRSFRLRLCDEERPSRRGKGSFASWRSIPRLRLSGADSTATTTISKWLFSQPSHHAISGERCVAPSAQILKSMDLQNLELSPHVEDNEVVSPAARMRRLSQAPGRHVGECGNQKKAGLSDTNEVRRADKSVRWIEGIRRSEI
jgi:hypothetical protein